MSIKHKEVIFLKEELSLMNDSSFLRTKLVITEKVFQLLRNTEEKLKTLVQSDNIHLPEEVLTRTAKISKGEKYLDLPYLVLDYPRYFSNDSIFAYRTMFWWGNFFSCTLHLQGTLLDFYRDRLLQNLTRLQDAEVHVCVNKSPWEYHYEPSNYISLNTISEGRLSSHLQSASFVKLSKKLPLDEIQELPRFAEKSFIGFYNQLK